MVYIDVYTGYQWYPEKVHFELNNKTDTILKGGPYFNRYALYQSQICLVDGTYTFTMHGGWDRLCGSSYKLYTKEDTKYNIILGGSYFYYTKTISFKLHRAS